MVEALANQGYKPSALTGPVWIRNKKAEGAAACLIFIEDRRFKEHRGVSLRGALRAIKDYVLRGRISGGSTITQQLVRSLFIVEYHKLLRRKLLEVLLALWIEQVASKDEILGYYLASVRFDEGVYGWIHAGQHFFDKLVRTPSRAEAFFLVERISNIKGRVLVSRIDDLIGQAVRTKVLSEGDAAELVLLYRSFVKSNRLKVQDKTSVDRLLKNWAKTESA